MSTTLNQFVDAQNNLVVQHSDFSLRALHDMATAKSIDLEPHYQRRDRWKPPKQSALIESFLLNVPVPPVYLSEDEFGKYSVIDGKQRITAIRDFLSNQLRLVGVQKFHELEGCSYSKLPSQIQNALSVRPYIRVITLLKQTDPELKFEVFLRLNTGGEKLLAQEIRNVAFSGPFNDLLIKLSETAFLKERLKIRNNKATAYRNMDDVEHVLRFLTISETWQTIGQLLSQEMDSFMRDYRNASPSVLGKFADRFLFSLDACQRLWGTHAFYKPLGNGWRAQFISPLYDAEMVAASMFSAADIAKIANHKRALTTDLVAKYRNDSEFHRAVTQSTNNPASVRKRINVLRDLMSSYV